MFWIFAIVCGVLATPVLAGSYQPAPGTNVVEVIRSVWHDASRDRDVPVKIYSPKTGAGPFPVILFSHGLGGSREGYAYLGEYWAAHGYVSVHLQHPGSDDGIFANGGARHFMETMKKVIDNPQNSINRNRDVSFAIDQLAKLNTGDSPVRGRVDLLRIGMAGHSFGAATTLAVAGEQIADVSGSFLDPRIKAAVAMSPPIVEGSRFDHIHIPVFVLTGTEDEGFTRTADRRTAYDKIMSPETCLVIFNGADHFTFSGHFHWWQHAKDREFQPLIREATTAFWDANLRGDAAAKAWLEQGGFATRMGSKGKFELR